MKPGFCIDDRHKQLIYDEFEMTKKRWLDRFKEFGQQQITKMFDDFDVDQLQTREEVLLCKLAKKKSGSYHQFSKFFFFFVFIVFNF